MNQSDFNTDICWFFLIAPRYTLTWSQIQRLYTQIRTDQHSTRASTERLNWDTLRNRDEQMESLLPKFDQTMSASQLWRHITLLSGIYWVSGAWKNAKDTTIQERFVLAHFLPNVEPNSADNNYDDNDIMLICPTSDLLEIPNQLDTMFHSAISTEDKIRLWKDLVGHYNTDETQDSHDTRTLLSKSLQPQHF